MEQQPFELQPLRIQAGWKVEYNSFTDYDIELHNRNEMFSYLVEDLLQLSFHKEDGSDSLIIDLGWYPSGDANGSYKLLMVKGSDWSAPLETFETKLKSEVVSKIEYWVCYGFFRKYL